MTDISGGFRGEPKSVRQWMDRELADPTVRAEVEETKIALHAHTDVGWVSWRSGRSFGQIHLERREYPAHVEGKTLCGVNVPTVGRIVRDQFSAPIEDLCRNCLKQFATHREG